mgnify:CR=1 FL=1
MTTNFNKEKYLLLMFHHGGNPLYYTKKPYDIMVAKCPAGVYDLFDAIEAAVEYGGGETVDILTQDVVIDDASLNNHIQVKIRVFYGGESAIKTLIIKETTLV